MPNDCRKMNKHSTGTVPKIKCRNNTSHSNERDSPHSWTNNLMSADCRHLNLSELLGNSRRNFHQHHNFSTMNTTIEDHKDFGHPINDSIVPNTTSTSRRNSSGTTLKCDNVTKYPDKKQIEDKLSQIREYLQITTSLMTSMKNTDDQSGDAAERDNLAKMIKDLKDSEAKLVDILDHMSQVDVKINEIVEKKNREVMEYSNEMDNCISESLNSQRNEIDDRRDQAKREMGLLRDQQMSLLSLQQKAENKLRDARQIQEKLMMAPCGNDLNSITTQRDKNLGCVQDFDAAIRELEERTKRLKEPRGSNSNLQDRLLADVDNLQSQIICLHNVNEDRNQLIQVLDNRDCELRAQHQELQAKLGELQTKKLQVDQLVMQLQNLDEAGDDEDVGVQVKRIVTMKDQLSKLKDMLEIVKTTETVMQNPNGSLEEQELACEICTKAENFLQKDFEKSRTPTATIEGQHENNVPLRYDNTGSINDNRHKQINKNTVLSDRHAGYGGAKPKTTSNTEKLALQTELEAKKRELEEIMGKHKAGTSNLNHDVGTDNKSEFSCTSNAYFDGAPGWFSMSEHNRFESSDSDECHEDVNEYCDLMRQRNHSYSLPTLKYPKSKGEKGSTGRNSDYGQQIQENDHRLSSSLLRNPERNSIAANSDRGRSNSVQSNKTQVQKQLELIRSVCDSMLEQNQGTNVQQLRNNLTPSPLYSEPRRSGIVTSSSPNPHSMNAIVNSQLDSPWPIGNQNDPGNCQGLLASNTLQTQAFMLNTLNQCCQMLWLQQRELMALRQTVNQMQQEGMGHFDNSQNHLASPLQNPNDVVRASRCNHKINQVPAACSMPNLNQYNIPTVNIDPSCHNNMQSARLLDPCLNNANLNPNSMSSGAHINNSVLHGVNANINQMPAGQMWNGQALNNQVAPGNRANNYWDNFRSYSRQNLLSTKSNDSFHNLSSLERSNNCSNPISLMSLSKSNSDQTSMTQSQDSTPHRRTQFVHLRNSERSNSEVPPDVLNVNPNIHKSKDLPAGVSMNQRNNDTNFTYQYANNVFPFLETSSNNSNVSEDQIPENARTRNEWREQTNEEPQHHKSKLFEELRDNVYKEVVTLITANEARPHFLIQLFRDLQMISSDPLRLKILQSIQTIITHSLASTSQINQQVLDTQQSDDIMSNFSLQSTVWSKSPKNSLINSRNTLHMQENEVDVQNAIKDLMPYMDNHEDEIIAQQFLLNLKQVLIESKSFQETVRDSVFKKHFSNVLDEVLTQYHGKKVNDVKLHIIQNITELLRGELSFIQLIQETCPENCEAPVDDVLGANQSIFEASNVTIDGPPIQNGDLAEADQGRAEEDDDGEVEGAVGGFWNLQVNSPDVANAEDVDLGNGGEFQNNAESQTQFIKQGLDQVPTRLPTKSRSNTPNKS